MNENRTDPPGIAVVGIDLGTTNSALAWLERRGPVQRFAIPQLVAPGEIAVRPVLPSFVYLPTDDERAVGALRQPWDDEVPAAVVGEFAREQGALVPSRQIASAKSWLANPSVDRTAALLPWGVETGPRMSPVEASARVLCHMRDAWNFTQAQHDPDRRLEQQSIVVTVPASFDEEARELTVDAARRAGFRNLTLLEEPLAAVYAWIAAHRRAVGRQLGDGELLLVCDVGGGTTDFTLIRASTQSGSLKFERTAIGEHLLLGGDNLDLSLAVRLEQKLREQGAPRLTLSQRHALGRKCSAAKEQLLAGVTDDRVRMTLLGAGRGVVGGGMAVDLTRADVIDALNDGFLPIASADDVPARDRRVGLRELGLPYENDPAITRHLAAFLARSGRAGGGEPPRPDVVLFNGGFFAPAVARERVLTALERWLGRRPRVLENARPELAVAAGAAFYGHLREDPAAAARLLIRAGSARGYYIGVAVDEAERRGADAARTAVCAMPRGTQEGTTLSLDREFTVIANQPLAFTLYSSIERADALNDLVTFAADADMHAHAPLVTALRFGKRSRRVPLQVRLTIAFTETGTLELWCESTATPHRWRLAFNLRRVEADPFDAAPGVDDETGADTTIVIDDQAVQAAGELIREVFDPGRGVPSDPGSLIGNLESVLGHGKHAWPLPVLRKLADALLNAESGRRQSPAFESRWLNLVGFCTRPGFGTSVDPWRIGELRKVYAAGLAFPREIQCQVEWVVLWQRVAGGFNTGQQRELAQRVAAQLGLGQRKPPRLNPQLEREGWRLLASLERLDAGMRTRLGDGLLERIRKEPRNSAWLWSLGRLGSRAPAYGPLSSVVPPGTAERWMDALLGLKAIIPDAADAIVQIGALTGDPARDVGATVRHSAAERLRGAGCAEQGIAPLLRAGHTAQLQTARAFGEPLPEGLRLEPARPDG